MVLQVVFHSGHHCSASNVLVVRLLAELRCDEVVEFDDLLEGLIGETCVFKFGLKQGLVHVLSES